jgi:hypothetical protein
MKENPKFAKAISEYIIKTPKENLSGDAFNLLADIYDSSNFKEVTTLEFVKALFNGLGIIQDEENFNAIVKILSQINFDFHSNNPEENIFLAVYKDHENSNILIESLLRIANHEEKDKETVFRALRCFMDMMDVSQNCILYSSDLESFINLAIQKLESTYTDELRYYLLETLERITRFDDYYNNCFKKDTLEELLDNYTSDENVEERNQELAKKVLQNLQSH